MGKDLESWLHQQQQPRVQFCNASSFKLPFDSGMQKINIPCAIPCTNAVPPDCTVPALGFPELSNYKLGQLKEPSHGLYSSLPHYRQGVVSDATLRDMLLPKVSLPAVNNPTALNGNAGKQFLVFDQSGNKTTMILSSEISTPMQQLRSWLPTKFGNCDASLGQLETGSKGHCFLQPNLTDEIDDDLGTNDGGEMHEDTDEINALLYSDDEDSCSENSEEASTGHSPSTMTAYDKQDWFEEEDLDEVASSVGPLKRQKLSDSGSEVPTVTSATCSVKLNRSSEYEDDAESSCVGGEPMRSSVLGSLSGNKRLRRDKIRDTVSVLQTILPGGKGKDAVMVLDEAINCLTTLRFKATTLGLSAL